VVAGENADPALHVVLPGLPDSDRTIAVLFPSTLQREKKAVSEAEHFIYFGRADWTATRVATGRKIAAVRKGFRCGIHMLARATLEGDGVRFCYEFTNRSSTAYDMIYAVTDPRLGGIFHDERLERTYVPTGTDLICSHRNTKSADNAHQTMAAVALSRIFHLAGAAATNRSS